MKKKARCLMSYSPAHIYSEAILYIIIMEALIK